MSDNTQSFLLFYVWENGKEFKIFKIHTSVKDFEDCLDKKYDYNIECVTFYKKNILGNEIYYFTTPWPNDDMLFECKEFKHIKFELLEDHT